MLNRQTNVSHLLLQLQINLKINVLLNIIWVTTSINSIKPHIWMLFSRLNSALNLSPYYQIVYLKDQVMNTRALALLHSFRQIRLHSTLHTLVNYSCPGCESEWETVSVSSTTIWMLPFRLLHCPNVLASTRPVCHRAYSHLANVLACLTAIIVFPQCRVLYTVWNKDN